ncbi:MAG: PKD domain-containing protein [Thermoplasmata archaeon]
MYFKNEKTKIIFALIGVSVLLFSTGFMIIFPQLGVLINPINHNSSGNYTSHGTKTKITSAANAPYFPSSITHFVILYRENHVFDDYLGDLANPLPGTWEAKNKASYPNANAVVESTNHIADVPYLHMLAWNYTVFDNYFTGTPPASGPNHWYLFAAAIRGYATTGGYTGVPGSGNLNKAHVTGETGDYPSTGTVFDRYLNNSIPWVEVGDIYWILNKGQAFTADSMPSSSSSLGWMPVDRPGTNIPEEIDYSNYTNNSQSVPDEVAAGNYINYVQTYGLPVWSYVELFNDHQGQTDTLTGVTYPSTIAINDAQTYRIVQYLEHSQYANNTMIVVTEDDTSGGANGHDHVSNSYRVPLVVIAPASVEKHNYLVQENYNTTNVIAAAERVIANVYPNVMNWSAIGTGQSGGSSLFPMNANDSYALENPLEAIWKQPSNTTMTSTIIAKPTSGNVPLNVSFSAQVSGGNAPYTYTWSFGDGNSGTGVSVSHVYNQIGNYTVTLKVSDSSGNTATSNTVIKVIPNSVALNVSINATPMSGNAPLNVSFMSTVRGGNAPYSYSWSFGDGAQGTTANVNHIFTNSGTYNTVLTVTDSSGNKASSNVTISVTGNSSNVTPLLVKASANVTSGTIPLNVQFYGNATGGIAPYSWKWTFGDGATSTSQNPTHLYPVSGNYTVNLTVTDSNGNSRSSVIYINALNPNSAPTYSVTFKSNGLPSNQSFSVTFNGTTQSSSNGQVSFTEPNGTYQYTVTSPSGYNATPSSGTITVNGQAVSTAINFTQTSTPSPSPSPTSPGVYSQVNATSANIQYYGLPGSERFQVNSTVTVNYIVLLLEGSGTITFSIGTGYNRTDVVSTTNVNVNSPNSGTYVMVTFTGVTLKGGTSYYLNVHDPKKTGVQWGYTTSPSVSQGALEDYYFTSNGLTHDNQFPDIYAIGYSGSSSQALVQSIHAATQTYPNIPHIYNVIIASKSYSITMVSKNF